MSCRPNTRSSLPQKMYTTGIGSSKASQASIKHKIDRHSVPSRRLASFEEACEKETFARCLADLSRRSSSGIPSMYSSQRITSSRYPPPFERSLSSSQLPRGDYGYIRNVRRPTSPRDSGRYSDPFPGKSMVRQQSEPGISTLYEKRTTPLVSSAPKPSRSVEALVSPTSRQSPMSNRNSLKPSKTRACQSLEAINEPTGNQMVTSRFVARIPRKASDPGMTEEKKGGSTQHASVKLPAKNKDNNTTQSGKKERRGTQRPMRKSASVDDRLCSSTHERERHTRRTSSIPKVKNTNAPQSHSKSKKDQNGNDTSPIVFRAKSPGSVKSKVTVKNPSKKQDSDKNAKVKEKKVVTNTDLKVRKDNRQPSNEIVEHRNQSNSKQSDDKRQMARKNDDTLDSHQQQTKRSSTKIPISSKVVGQLMSRQIVPDELVLQDSISKLGITERSCIEDDAERCLLDVGPVGADGSHEEELPDPDHLVESPVKSQVEEVAMSSQPQDIFSGVDLSSAIEQGGRNLQGRISPPKTLIPYVQPVSPPSSQVKKQQRDQIRREKMEMVFEMNPPRLSLKKQVSFDVDMSVLHVDGTKEKSSFRTEKSEAIETNDQLLFGSMFGWRASSPTNSEVSSDNLSDVFVRTKES
ncbi:uncharacterized protein [Amphiura filiformis]|uniref:uncharacterized protein n=1 Tax=Amphiura filiformis TaxID=82378 RepID=UPI003B2222D0